MSVAVRDRLAHERTHAVHIDLRRIRKRNEISHQESSAVLRILDAQVLEPAAHVFDRSFGPYLFFLGVGMIYEKLFSFEDRGARLDCFARVVVTVLEVPHAFLKKDDAKTPAGRIRHSRSSIGRRRRGFPDVTHDSHGPWRRCGRGLFYTGASDLGSLRRSCGLTRRLPRRDLLEDDLERLHDATFLTFGTKVTSL